MAETTILNNRYRLEERLGSGGMAMVYRARDLTLERTVAIKILRRNLSENSEFRSRFHQEAKAAANLSHPNIVTVHDFGFYASQLYIVMEYVPGSDLKTLLQQKRPFDIAEAIDLIAQACAGLGYAHRAGLVHCDVKPQNMLVTPDRRLKVVDFGISRLMATISPDERSEVVWGSPQYFSPEQAAGSAPSPASDVYSLGVILYEMLAGRLPFVAATPQELARQHREALPPSPRRYNPAIPIPLEQIMIKVLAKEPSSRYRTADQLGRVLTNFVQQPQPVRPSFLAPGNQTTVPPGMAPQPPSPPLPQLIAPPEPSVTVLQGPANTTVHQATPELVVISTQEYRTGADYLTWLLALLALVALIGLIPFWLWVYSVLYPPF
jgi:eukaryotic-like serine/threonine-protein kinase